MIDATICSSLIIVRMQCELYFAITDLYRLSKGRSDDSLLRGSYSDWYRFRVDDVVYSVLVARGWCWRYWGLARGWSSNCIDSNW